MKKLLLTLMGVILCAISGNAQIYFMGDGTGLTWDSFPGLEVQLGDDGYYTHEFTNLNSFKFSKNKATGWDNGFNAGAYQLASGSFGDAVYGAGQTLSLTAGSEKNIETPWAGKYVVKIKSDFSTITLSTTTAKPTNAPDAYLVGSISGWGINQAYKFSVAASGSNYVYTLDVNLAANAEFKIAGASGTSVNWGGPINYGTGGTISATQMDGREISIAYNGNNMKLGAAFEGTITLTIPQTAKQAGKIQFTPKSVQVTYPKTMYLVGETSQTSWTPTDGIAMTVASEGVYTLDGVSITGTFAFAEAIGTWDIINGNRYGPATNGTKAVVGSNKVDGAGDVSWSITKAGKYNVKLDLVNSTLTLTEAGNLEVPVPSALYIIGNVNGQGWNPTNTVAMTSPSTGVFSIENVVIGDELASGSGFISFCSSTTDDNTDDGYNKIGTRYGAAENDQVVVAGTSYDVFTGQNSFKLTPGAWNITVTFANGSATAVFTVYEEPEPEPELGDNIDVTFNFGDVNDVHKYNKTIPTNTSSWTADGTTGARYAITGLQLTSGGVTLSDFVQNSATNTPAIYQLASGVMDLRLYSGNTFTLSVPEGYRLVSVDARGTASATQVNKFNVVAGQQATYGKFEQSGSGSGTTHMVWTAAEGTEFNSLPLTVTGTSRIAEISVVAEKIQEVSDDYIQIAISTNATASSTWASTVTMKPDSDVKLQMTEPGVYVAEKVNITTRRAFYFYKGSGDNVTKYMSTGGSAIASMDITFGNSTVWPGDNEVYKGDAAIVENGVGAWYIYSTTTAISNPVYNVTVNLNTMEISLEAVDSAGGPTAPEALYIYGNVKGYQIDARYTNVATLAKQGTTNVYSGTYDVPACGPFTPDGEWKPNDGAPASDGWYGYLCDNKTSSTASGAKTYQAPLSNFLFSPTQVGQVYTATTSDGKSDVSPFIITTPGKYTFEFNFDTKAIKITLNELTPAIALSAEVPQANVTGKTAQLNYEYKAYNATNISNVKLNVALENVEGGNEKVITEDLSATSGTIILSGLKDGITYKAAITVTATVGAGVEVVSNVYALQFTTPEIEEVNDAYLGITTDGTFPDAPDKSKAMPLDWDENHLSYSFSGTFTLQPGQGVNVWGPSGIMTDDPENPNPYPGLQPMGPDGDSAQDLFFKTGETTVSGTLLPSLNSYWVVKNTIPVEIKVEYTYPTITLTCLTDVSGQEEGGGGDIPDNNGEKMFIAQALGDPSQAAYGTATSTSPSADDVQLAYIESAGVYYGQATFASKNGQGYNRSWRVYTAQEAGEKPKFYYTSAKASEWAGANLVFDNKEAVVEQGMVTTTEKTGFSWNVKTSGGFPDGEAVGTVYMVYDINNMTAKFSLSPFKFETVEEPIGPEYLQMAKGTGTQTASVVMNPETDLKLQRESNGIYVATGLTSTADLPIRKSFYFYTGEGDDAVKYMSNSTSAMSPRIIKFWGNNYWPNPDENVGINEIVENGKAPWYINALPTGYASATYAIVVNLNDMTLALTTDKLEDLEISNGADDTLQSTYIDEESSIVAMTVDQSKDWGLLFVNVPAGAVAEYQIIQETDGGIGGGPVMASVMEAYEECPKWKGNYCIPLMPNTMGTLQVRYDLNGYVSEPQTWNFIVSSGKPTGVNGIAAEEDGVEYYTLDGVKVKNPERGIYIRVANGKTTKVVK